MRNHLIGISEGCNSLTSIELAALNMLLSGDDPILKNLRSQHDVVKIINREYTGVGYVTHFGFDSTVANQLDGISSIDISDVFAKMPKESDTLMFHLAIRDGHLAYFEAVTVGEEWPAANIDSAQLMYFDRLHPKGCMDRDLHFAREQWFGISH